MKGIKKNLIIGHLYLIVLKLVSIIITPQTSMSTLGFEPILLQLLLVTRSLIFAPLQWVWIWIWTIWI